MPFKIKIPVGLPTAIAPMCLRKRAAMCCLLLLKQAYEDCGKFRAPFRITGSRWNKDGLRAAAAEVYMPLRTLERHVRTLITLDLITHEHGMYKLASWEDIIDRYELPHNKRPIYLLYDPEAIAKADNGYNLVHELKSMAADDVRKESDAAVRTRIHYNPELKQELKTIADLTHWSREAVFHMQLKAYLDQGMTMDLTPDQYDILQHMRCDIAISTESYNYLFEYHSRGGMAYQKRRWEEMDMIRVIHRRIEIEPGRFTKRQERELSKYGDIVWEDHNATPITWGNVAPENRIKATERRLWLILPDEIYRIPPKDRKWMKEPKAA